MLEFAQKYLNAGFSIIPLAPNSKRPALESWSEFQQRRPTLDEVAQWWQNGSNYGIAVVCGKVSDIVVLDIDDEEKFGVALKTIGEKLPDTPIARTRKGWHLYFRYPANRIVRRHDRLDDWGAELRGDGCYVVAPPTVIDGKRYHWAKRNGRLMALGEVPIAECPDWLLDDFNVPFADEQNEPNTAHQSTQPQNYNDQSAGNGLPSWARTVVALLRPYWQAGWRHDTALALAGVFAKRGIPKETAEAILRELVRETGDNEAKDRLRALMDTYGKLAEGENVLAW
jgi:hypothetical protein